MWLLLLALACDSADSGDSPVQDTDSGPSGGDSGETGDTSDSGDSADTADTADSGDTGEPTPVIVDEPVDVVIVGAGVAGLAAAIEAFEAGATVRVLEREAFAGGAANYAGGLMVFSGTPEQAAAGIVDSPELLAADWPEITGGDPADPWFLYFAQQNVLRVHDWLSAMGMSFTGPMADTPRGSADRIHVPKGGGPGLVATLVAAAPADVITFGATAQSLEVEDGRVAGVRWSDGTDDHYQAADAVIIATGGFLHDLARVEALFPELPVDQLVYGSSPAADGAGLDMLTGLGASTQNMQAIGFYAHATLSPEGEHQELVAGAFGVYPWVGVEGVRFVDEWDFRGFQVGRTRAMLPGGDVWLFADNALEGDDFFPPADESVIFGVDELVASGIVVKSDTLDGLAGDLGLDPATVTAQMAAWNAGGDALEPPRADDADDARGVVEPPFYAVPVVISVAKAFGGVDVDLQGRVLTEDGAVIPGVYAAGELTGMLGGSIVGDYGFTGSLTAVALGGRVAGENAAAEALLR